MRLLTYTFTFLFAIVICFTANGQVDVKEISFNKVLKKATAQKKVLMVIMDNSFCEQCSTIFNNTLANVQSSSINETAFVVRYTPADKDWNELNKKYNRSSSLVQSVLYFNAKGDLIHRFDGFGFGTTLTSLKKELITASKYAQLPSINDRLKALETSANWNLDSLNQLRVAYRKFLLPTEDLLAEYVAVTPIDSFKTFSYFKMLAYFTPKLNSKEDSIIRNSNLLINWNKLSIKDKSAISYDVAQKTMAFARATKNKLLAEQTANYISNNTENLNEKEKQLLKLEKLAGFFDDIKDTTNYFNYNSIYVDTKYMSLSIDSLKQVYELKEKHSTKDSLYLRLKYGEDENPFPYKPYAATFYTYGRTLNVNAIMFYLETTNPTHLKEALEWAKRSIEFCPRPEVLETYAKLLYFLGKKEDAIAQQQTALAEEKRLYNRPYKIKELEDVLLRMQENDTELEDIKSGSN